MIRHGKFYEFILNNYKTIVAILFLIILILAFCLIYILQNKQNLKISNLPGNITLTPSGSAIIPDISKAEKELIIGKKTPGTTEVIEIHAKKATNQDKLALVRLKIIGGEIVDVKSNFLLLPSCTNNKNIDGNNLCIDIAKTEAFIDGEILVQITIKWDQSQNQHIYKVAGYGMYNGLEFHSID